MADPIRLGLLAPMTGIVGMYGKEIVRAARIAVEEVNAAGGVNGQSIELIVEDDGSLPDTAAAAAQRLAHHHRCCAMIGNLLSNSRLRVVEEVADPLQLPLLNFSFYEGSIASRYFFHFAALPNQQIERMIPFMARQHGSKFFFAGNNYEWPRGSIDAAKRCLKRIGGDLVGEEYRPIGLSQGDIDMLLDLVAKSGADVFVPYFAGEDQLQLLRCFAAAGLKSRMSVIMGHFDELLASQLAESVREGFYSTNTYFMPVDTPCNHEVLQKIAAQPGISGLWPEGDGILTNFGEGAYLCVRAFAKALQMAGGEPGKPLLWALGRVEVSSPQGLVRMDPVFQHAAVNSYIARCQLDGSFVIVESCGRIAPLIPDRYRSQQRISASRFHEGRRSDPETVAGDGDDHSGGVPQQIAQSILSVADVAVIATDEKGVITEVNRGANEVFGYEEGALIGVSVHQLLPPHLRERHAMYLARFVAGVDNELRMGARSELMGYRRDGSFFPVEASIAKFHHDTGWSLVVTLRDVTERKRAEEALTRRATHDVLTGLPNRYLIRERLDNALNRTRRSVTSVGVMFLDLDGFKLINDTHGHEVGDALLKQVAHRLLSMVRPGDTVARLAGDEFLILSEHVDEPASMALFAQRLNDALRAVFNCNNLSLLLTCSIGVAIGHGTTHSSDDLMRCADTAMYAVKERGRDGWQFYNESLQVIARQRLEIKSGLRQAIERNELSTRFQPIVTARSGRIVGAELLLRWHPEQGEISPSVFIPIAEMFGSIVPIGEWVFRQGCIAEVRWRQRWGVRAPYLSINLSARQLGEPDLPQRFASIVADTGADPSRMVLEITETSLMADVEANLRSLRVLTDQGFRIAVDDFGTGYSSLAQLSRLPVHVLKIDRAFVDGLDANVESRTIIRSVIGLGRSLGLKLIAEGVERLPQLQELRSEGCDFLQGYYFSPPVREAEFEAAIAKGLSETSNKMPAPLECLVYVSQATVLLNQEELQALLHSSRERNRELGVSGCLLHRGGEYMQMLEGNPAVLDGLLNRIAADPRHRDVEVVLRGPVRRRVFQDWEMLLRDLGDSPIGPELGTPKRRISFKQLSRDAPMCYALITAFSTQTRELDRSRV